MTSKNKNSSNTIRSADNIAIVILAAGASKRMGTPKQILSWKKSVLINDVISKGLKCFKHVYVVLGAHRDIIERKISSKKVTIIENPRWEAGMGTSISEAVTVIEKKEDNINAILFALVDQPLLQVKHYKRLIKSFIECNNNIIATKNNEHIGVPAILGSSYFSKLKKLDGDVGAKGIISSNKEDTWVVDPVGDIVDLDTMDAYKKLYKEYGQK